MTVLLEIPLSKYDIVKRPLGFKDPIMFFLLLLDFASPLRIMILQLVDTEARKVCFVFCFPIAALSLQ